MLANIWRVIRHNHILVNAILTCCIIVVWVYGCESQVKSLNDTGQMVTRQELQIELDTLLGTASLRFTELDRQDEFKQALIEQAYIFAETNTINPFGLLTLLSGILGIGAVIDNRRKDAIIKTNLTTYTNAKKETA